MPANLDKCVADLTAQGHAEDSAWAICRAALGEAEWPTDVDDATRQKAIAITKESLTGLSEARNVGNWLESRIHMVFTEIADDLFGNGHLTREERIALSAGIGQALDAFTTSVQGSAAQLYARDPFDDPDDPRLNEAKGKTGKGVRAALANALRSIVNAMDDDDEEEPKPKESVKEAKLVEAGDSPNLGKLSEAALRRDGTVNLKIIEPGWGSSGFYPAEVLERDGPQVFRSGTQMFWNHQTLTEEMERPEGDLNALAGELVSDARWQENGPAGPGLYADAQVFGPFQESVDELAGHIGVSIRAEGEAQHGTAEGRQGPIIQRINAARSVDYVTQAGAGGEILELFEAARQKAAEKRGATVTTPSNDTAKLQERMNALEQENARLREREVFREARETVGQLLQEADIPDITRRRLAGQLAQNPPTTEAGALDTEALGQRVKEAVDAEVDYLRSVTGNASPVRGMGGGTPDSTPTDHSAALEESFLRLTGSESAAKIAASGR